MNNDVNDQILQAEIEAAERLLRYALDDAEDLRGIVERQERRLEHTRGVYEESLRRAMVLEERLNLLDVKRAKIGAVS